jgi:L-amino acid N-acyltransferase YncA
VSVKFAMKDLASLMIIRTVSVQDAAAIAAIYAHHVLHGTATFDTEPRSVTDTAAKIADCAGRGWPFLVTELDGEVVGYAYATQFRDRAAYAFACENSIYIDTAHIGRGLGKALLIALLPAAANAGFRQMIAVIAGGETASIALHAGLGFRDCGTVQAVGRKFGRWLDTVYMQIAVGAGDSEAPGWEPQ